MYTHVLAKIAFSTTSNIKFYRNIWYTYIPLSLNECIEYCSLYIIVFYPTGIRNPLPVSTNRKVCSTRSAASTSKRDFYTLFFVLLIYFCCTYTYHFFANFAPLKRTRLVRRHKNIINTPLNVFIVRKRFWPTFDHDAIIILMLYSIKYVCCVIICYLRVCFAAAVTVAGSNDILIMKTFSVADVNTQKTHQNIRILPAAINQRGNPNLHAVTASSVDLSLPSRRHWPFISLKLLLVRFVSVSLSLSPSLIYITYISLKNIYFWLTLIGFFILCVCTGTSVRFVVFFFFFWKFFCRYTKYKSVV